MPDNKPDSIIEAIVRRETYLHRFASGLVNEHIDSANTVFAKVLPAILNEFGDVESLTRADKQAIERIIKKAIKEQYGSAWGDMTDDMHHAAMLDIAHISDIYDDFLDQPFMIPAAATVAGAINASQMVLTSGSVVRSGVWAEHIKNNTDAISRAVMGEINAGYNNGLTNQEIARNIRGTYNRTTKEYQGGLLQGRVKRQADTLTRTGVSHFSNSARDRMYQANDDLIETRVFFATMDNRTTTTCMGFNLQEWDINDKAYPRLPLHYNERSNYLVRLKGIDPLHGTKPAVSGTTNKVDYSTKRRGNKDDRYGVKQVRADMGSDEFLRRQPRAYVESSLGKTRARLFLDGKVPIKSFTDLVGKPLTLKEMESISANDKAFRLAGLSD